MLFINHFGSSQAAIDYHGHLSRGDYYAKDAPHLMPRFEGETARMLGIEGMKADKESWTALARNHHPVTGEKITAGWKADRRSMTDLTFDVPKSVTLAGLLDKRIDGAMDDAIHETMLELQEDMATRVRKGGKDEDRVTGNMIWVVWPHETTRPLEDGTIDPHKHRHVTALNITFDHEEGIYKACQFGNIVRDKGYFQSAYHARLGKKLSDLGYGVERDGNSFRLTGIDRALADKFSRRTAVIENEAEKRGIVDVFQKGKLGRQTRNKKADELSTPELHAEWLGRMTKEERQSLIDARRKTKGPSVNAEEGLQYAIDHSFERVSTVSEKRLKGEALRYAVGSITPDDLDQAVDARVDLIRVERGGERIATTRGVLQDEVAMLKFARDSRGQYAPLASEGVWSLPERLTAEQGAAAARVLNSRDGVIGIEGKAGTGKTTTLKAIVCGIEENGVAAFGCAPSANAAQELRQAGIQEAHTLERVLVDPELQKKLRGKVLITDEAGMISTRDMGRLFKVAKEQDFRVILSGDYRQHGSVQAGDAFRLLEHEAGVGFARLKEIRRQSVKEYKAAVTAISSGSKEGVRKGFNQLDKMGAIIEASGEERHKMLVADYLKAAGEGKSALIIAPTHKEGDRLTEELRQALKEQGQVGAVEHAVKSRRATQWTAAEKRDARNYEPGMVVEFYQNVKGGFKRGETALVTGTGDSVTLLRQDGTKAALPVDAAKQFQVYRVDTLKIAQGDRIRVKQNGNLLSEPGRKVRVNNGDIFTVAGFGKDGNIKLEGGKVLPKNYGHIGFGYVDTSYASQGKTVDRVFIATGAESLRATNQQQWYVSVSRGRELARVYVDSKEDVREAIQRSGERLAAVELVKQEKPSPVQEKLFEMNRVMRYLREKRRRDTANRKLARSHAPGI